MQGILSGGLLVVAFAAVAGLALLVVVRLYRISSPGQPSGAQPGAQPAGGPSAGAQPGPRPGRLPLGQAGERPDA